MPSAESHPQNDFMNAARKERKRVEIYLVNGIRLTGCIESFDQYLVMLRTPVGLQGIYKRAISTIQLDTGTRPGPRPGGPRTSHGEHTSRGPHGNHGGHGSHGPREQREPREPREPRENWSGPAGTDRPSQDGPVVVTRRRRLYGAVNNGGNGGDDTGNN
jgi:host factor-I protein